MSSRSALWRGVLGLLLVVLVAITFGASGERPALAQPPACDYEESVLADNPIGYWRLGEASGTTAVNIGSLGSAVDGTYQGGVTLGVGGLVEGDDDTAASFNGADGLVTIPSHAQINEGGPYTAKTIELWFSANDLTGMQVLYEQGGDLNGLNIFLDDDELYIGAWEDSEGDWVMTPVTVDTDYHVALVFDGSAETVTGYLDGVSIGTTDPITSALPAHTDLIGIGSFNVDTRYPGGEAIGETGDNFYGVIDEVALYNRVLTPARIQRHAAGCSVVGCDYQAIPSTDNPTAYWRLGETSGNTAFNISSLGNVLDATYENGVTQGATGLVAGDPDLAASFDGTDDYVQIPSHVEINIGGPYPARTVALWFRADDLTGTQMLYKEGGYLNGLNIFLEGNQLYVGAYVDGAGSDWVMTTVAVDTAYHVALVFDGSAETVTGYLDGVSIGTTDPIDESIPYHEGGVSIGAVYFEGTVYPTGPVTYDLGDHFDGTIDEVVLYNAVLSQARIQAQALGCGTATCYALTLEEDGNGSVPAASPTSSGGCAEGEYIAGTSIGLAADPDPGWAVTGWTGTQNDASTEDTNTVLMPASAHTAGVTYGLACYPLTLENTGNGSIPVADPPNSVGCAAGEYRYDATIDLSGADPDEGWEIDSWTGTDDDNSTDPTNTVTMPDGAHTAAVNYVESCYLLTLENTGNGSVPVASPTSSDGCAMGRYNFGEPITLSGATPDTGWEIGSWTGTDNDMSTEDNNTLDMPASDHTAAVNYTQICYPLTLERDGSGSVPVADPLNSPSCAAGEYVYGQSIGLTANPDTGWAVSDWTGTTDDESTEEINTVSMPASAHTAGVTYSRICYPLTLDQTGNGSVPVATPTNSTGCAEGEYYYSEFILLSDAEPDTGWEVSSWTGTDDDNSTDDFNTLSMPASAHTAAVNYSRVCYPLTLQRDGNGAVPVADPPNSSVCPAGEYVYGQYIELTADPDPGWSVSGWTGTDDDSSTEETNTLNMPANAHTASVLYGQGCYPLTVSANGNGTVPDTTPPNSTGCPAGQYIYDALILLSGADPDTGWQIDGWTGTDDDASTEAFNTVTMPASAHAAAVDYTQICYPLTLEEDGNGSVPVASPSNSTGCAAGEYYFGEAIGLTADPDTGWAVSSWSGTGDDASTEETNTLTMPASAHTAGVTYYRVCYPLTLERTGEGSVPVASPTNSTGCAVGEYYYDEPIALSGAAPSTGWEIDSWTGTDDDGSTGATNSLSMPASAHTAAVNYSRVCYPLTLSHTGEGDDPVASPNQSAGCAVGYYYYQEAIDLSGADPDTGWEISSWTGTSNDTSTGATNTLSMPASAHAAAVNYSQVCYVLTLERTGGGTVPVATPSNSTGCAAGQYYYGEAIDLSGADPDLGWEIDSWTGTDNNSSTADTNTLSMPASAHTAAVNYTQICYGLTFSNTGLGDNPVATPSNSTGCSAGYFHYQESIDLDANPDPGWRVASWTGTDNDSSTSETNTLTMPATAHAVIVHYEAIPQYTLTVTQSGYGSVTWDPTGDIHYDGTVVVLTPTPDPGWIFAGWSGPDAGDPIDNGDGTWSLTMDDDKEITARFLMPTYLPIITNGAVR